MSDTSSTTTIPTHMKRIERPEEIEREKMRDIVLSLSFFDDYVDREDL